METKTTTLVFLVALLALVTFLTTSTNAQQSNPPSSLPNATTSVTFEGTAMSTVDALVGHQMHQAVVVLPARVDGKLWVGTISWTASKPVELRLLYDYDTSVRPDAIHGRPATTALAVTTEAPHIAVGQIAISLLKPALASPPPGYGSIPSFNDGSTSFVAKAVAFHTVNGTPFTVTYAVDATPKQPTR